LKEIQKNSELFEKMDNLNGTSGNNGPARSYLPTVTNSMKWWLAILLGVLFFVIAFPGTYNLTNAIWTSLGLPSFLTAPGCPTTLAVLIHALVFALIVRLLLW
jgi:hypothetical protein